MIIFPILYSVSDLGAMSRMSGHHTGEHLASELEALLKTFGIEKKVCCVLNMLLRVSLVSVGRFYLLPATTHQIMTL